MSAGIREGIARLLADMAPAPEFPTQGATLFVDLQRRSVQSGYTPRRIVEALLAGRGANMFYLYRLLDESLFPLHPDVPLIFGAGILTGIVPSAARGNCTSWSPESGVILDSNVGDYFPSFLKMNGIDHLVLYGQSPEWTLLVIREGKIEWRDARPYAGLDNIDLRAGMTDCFRCPVNCRPLNDLHTEPSDRYGRGDGPEYVTVGKFGANLGISRIESVIRLNNACNDLGLDTAGTGSAIAWKSCPRSPGVNFPVTRRRTCGPAR